MASFDKATGVIYTEKTSARVGTMVSTWMSQSRGTRDKKLALRSRGTGCSSLQDMALRSCAYHVQLFEHAALKWAEWHYAEKIYRHLNENEALTYNAWNIFSDAYPDELNPHQRFHIYPTRGSYEPSELFSITNRLSKLDTTFVTFLSVRDFSLTFVHLKTILNVPTLATLVLEQARPNGTSAISTRNFLDWARARQEKNALKSLRVFILSDFGIDRRLVCEALSSFPVLQLVGVQNPRVRSFIGIPQSTYPPWEAATASELAKFGTSFEDFNPEVIWKATHLTGAEKAQQLYESTMRFIVDQPYSSAELYRSVSITYGGSLIANHYEKTGWLIREPPASFSKPVKEESPSWETPSRGSPVRKKRKIRTGKRLDVGCLLGAFK